MLLHGLDGNEQQWSCIGNSRKARVMLFGARSTGSHPSIAMLATAPSGSMLMAFSCETTGHLQQQASLKASGRSLHF